MELPEPRPVYGTDLGTMHHGDSLQWLDKLADNSVNLVLTSPPFALTRQKEYGNKAEDEYVAWFRKFADCVLLKLTDDGSFVIDLGGAWMPGCPTKSLYQYKLLIDLVDEGGCGFHLAQDLIWFNRAKLPGPRQWVNIDRVRVKDAANTLWWLSKTAHPKADNRKVLREYSKSMQQLLKRGTYNSGPRPSEHVIGETWAVDQGGAIPPNVIEISEEALDFDLTRFYGADTVLDVSNTNSTDPYLAFCRANHLAAHPARFPRAVPEFFIKLLTDPGDLVVDTFGGSNVTGAVAEAEGRRWASCELDADYIRGSVGRFAGSTLTIYPAGEELGVGADLSAFVVPPAQDQAPEF